MLFEAIILGIVQGLGEFLPISSSGHLILVEWATGWKGELINNQTFDVALHAGTLLAVLWHFRQDWFDMLGLCIKVMRRKIPLFEARLAIYLVIATIPAGVIGMKFEHVVEEAFRNPLLVAFALTAGSLAMWLSDEYSRKNRPLASMSLGSALFIGLAQALALMPGISRSGITISAGLATGFRREDAARFSFLLSTPIIAGATVFKLRHLSFHGSETAIGFGVGIVASAIVGYLAIRFLIKYLQVHSLNLFVWYRLVLAAGVIVLWMARGA